jgi:eukaryotic-like serine/threonine-protein kinase
MPPARGSRLGPYDVISALGAGGMGEVYRARDPKLQREVAIKILPELFASDPERLARFEREAQTLAALNHPNIAQVYGVLESPPALVMELVEGDDLAQHIARGPLPLDEAIAVARQVAEALEAAHERGIVHRDLKPANIRVRPDGTVKVLDFGLAKAVVNESDSMGSDPALSPTITSPARVHGTEAGIILGTAAYMAPEQARGRPVDRRTDIWAFGCVVYEMVTGRPPFRADTITDTLAAIVSREADWNALPATIPGSMRRLLQRCLEKDPRRRLQAIGEARVILEEAVTDSGDATQESRARLRRYLPWVVAGAALAVTGWAVVGRVPDAVSTAGRLYLDVPVPADIEPLSTVDSGISLAPNGKIVAMTGARGGARSVWVRPLDRDEVMEIAEPGVHGSVFSPDSTKMAVLCGRGLVAVSLIDGHKRLLTSSSDITGGVAWGPRGLVFSRAGALWLVAENGGEARSVTTLDASRGEVLHSGQILLPGGRTVLFVSATTQPGSERIESVSIDGGARSIVVDRATTPLWSPTGHLLFARDGAVLAVPFDPETSTSVGAARPVLPSGRIAAATNGRLALHLANDGTLLFVPFDASTRRLLSVARDGAALPLEMPRARYLNPRVSPDGRRVMVETDGALLEVLNLERQSRTRLSAAAPGTIFSTWSGDGRTVLFRRVNTPVWVSTDGSGRGGPVPGAGPNDFPSGAGADNDSFLVTRVQPDSMGDIFLVSISGAFEPRPLIATRAYEGGAQLSPDGRWLTYVSDASGRSEILVRPYPALERQWPVSEGAGIQPRWSRDGREIFYRDGTSLVAVPFNGARAEPVIGKPVPLFQDDYEFGNGITIANYDVTPEGRWILLRRESQAGTLRVVLNWTEELTQVLAGR